MKLQYVISNARLASQPREIGPIWVLRDEDLAFTEADVALLRGGQSSNMPWRRHVPLNPYRTLTEPLPTLTNPYRQPIYAKHTLY